MSTRTGNTPPQLLVRQLSPRATRGVLEYGPFKVPIAFGKGGVIARKREGDGATPRGRMALLSVYYNPSRVGRPLTALPVKAIRSDDGWCDAPCDRNYNRAVRHPYPASAERLWREDALYDVVVVLDYNLRPRRRGGGSAIFMHVARPGFLPTEGCIALKRDDLLKLLRRVRRGTRVVTSF